MTGQRSGSHWILQPLLDAGLDVDDVRALLVRVTFECLMTGGLGDVWDVAVFLGPQPPHVRAAWIETVGRMLHAAELVAGNSRGH